ncbi:hypothetical protein [Streptomyces sp. NPDC048309]|uniref:hypothetical protein n=1 Tax=Streptomyces sp. NPDC048309 TaxID=3154618 RepID=UPI0033D07429
MSLVIDERVFEKAGVKPKQGWTRDEYFAALKKIHATQQVAGDTGYFSIMYLYDLSSGRTARRSSPRTDRGSTRPI